MIRKLTVKLLVGLPSLIFLGVSYLTLTENPDYGFGNPGVDLDSVDILMMFVILAIASSAITLSFKHKDKLDFVIPYTVIFFAVWRLFYAINILTYYLEYYFYN